MNVWILNHYAYKDGMRHASLARAFSEKGADVYVFASSFAHGKHVYTQNESCVVDPVCERVTFVWLRTTPAYAANDARRVLNMISYAHLVRKFAPKLWKQYGKPDVVIGSSVHPFAWEAAYWICKKTGAKFICEVRDIWPLALMEIEGVSRYHPSVFLFGALERRAYKRANAIVTTFPFGYKHICEAFAIPREKVHWMPNGINTAEIDSALQDPNICLPKELDAYLTNNWCAVYAGSIVESECTLFLAGVAKRLLELGRQDICVAFIGDGHDRDKLLTYIKEQHIENAQVFPRITKQQVAVALKKAKVCIAAHHNHPIYRFGLSMNKLNDYLYSGTPTIFAFDGENVAKDAQQIIVPYGDTEAFAEALMRVRDMSAEDRNRIGESGRTVILENYDMSKIARAYLELMESL